MTSIFRFDLDMVETYLHAKNEVNRSKDSKVMTGKFMFFNVCDLNLDPLTLILKLDLDMVVVDMSKG